MNDEKDTKKSKTTKSKAAGVKKKKQTKEATPSRDEKGRFVPGKSGNPGGRPKLDGEFEKYAKLAPSELWKIVEDEEVGKTLKASILEWFAEMYYGKARQQVDVDAQQTLTGTTAVKFEGVLDEWAQ